VDHGHVKTCCTGTFTAPSPAAYIPVAETVIIVKKGSDYLTAQRIETGTVEGDALGFTGELFSGWLELYNNSRLYLHYIISRHRNEGNTQALISSWVDHGYDVRVVMPRPIMQHILGKFGFVPSSEYLPGQYTDVVDVWYRPADRETRSQRSEACSWLSQPGSS
jgi:hypothetical protein